MGDTEIDDHDLHDDHDDHGELDNHDLHDDHDDHEDEHDDHHDHDLETFKIIMLFAMIACCAFGIVPKVWGACQRSENVLSLLNCFSSGLFLGMSLTHMMPEAVEIYDGWAKHEGIERPFPLPYVGFFMGYVLILFVDRVIAKKFHIEGGHGHGGTQG